MEMWGYGVAQVLAHQGAVTLIAEFFFLMVAGAVQLCQIAEGSSLASWSHCVCLILLASFCMNIAGIRSELCMFQAKGRKAWVLDARVAIQCCAQSASLPRYFSRIYYAQMVCYPMTWRASVLPTARACTLVAGIVTMAATKFKHAQQVELRLCLAVVCSASRSDCFC